MISRNSAFVGAARNSRPKMRSMSDVARLKRQERARMAMKRAAAAKAMTAMLAATRCRLSQRELAHAG